MLQIIFIPESVYNFVASPFWGRVYLIIRVFFSIFSVILLIAIILTVYRMHLGYAVKARLKEYEEIGRPRPNRILERWKKIKERLDTNDENNYKLAILEADAMFDSAIENLGYKGKDFEDRAKQIPPNKISNLSEIMEAHKLRNTIVYDIKSAATYFQAKKAVEIFEKALKELDVM